MPAEIADTLSRLFVLQMFGAVEDIGMAEGIQRVVADETADVGVSDMAVFYTAKPAAGLHEGGQKIPG